VQFPSNVEPAESNTQTLEPLELELDAELELDVVLVLEELDEVLELELDVVLELELDAVLELEPVLELDEVLELDAVDEPPVPELCDVVPQPAAHGSAASTTTHAWRKPLIMCSPCRS